MYPKNSYYICDHFKTCGHPRCHYKAPHLIHNPSPHCKENHKCRKNYIDEPVTITYMPPFKLIMFKKAYPEREF